MIPANLIPRGYNWCVAGGFAACPPLASDIDVWVYGVKADDLSAVKDHLHQHAIEQYGNSFEHLADSREEHVPDVPDYEGDGLVVHLKVGVLTDAACMRKPVHIMVTTAPSIAELLETFDVSTHQAAISPSGIVFKGDDYSKPYEPVEALRDTPTTPARVEKIRERFGQTPAITPLTDEDLPF